MAFNAVRDYFRERHDRLVNLQALRQMLQNDQQKIIEYLSDPLRQAKVFISQSQYTDIERHKVLQSTFDQVRQDFIKDDTGKRRPFELFAPLAEIPPTEWFPSQGIELMDKIYHPSRIVTESPEVPITGYSPHHYMMDLLKEKYPQYLNVIDKYCRPLGTTLATFQDFNRPQRPVQPVNPERMNHVLTHVFKKLSVTPYLPLHFLDTLESKMPLNTGTGYHNRRSYKRRAHAQLSHPPEYQDRPTSKGYFINVTLEENRLLIHYIKYNGVPFVHSSFKIPIHNISREEYSIFSDKLEDFFASFPTLLFTRKHISLKTGPLKMRPVYAVDDLFLQIEAMLTFPLLVQACKPECCIMYGLETFRGANAYLDKIAQLYTSYFTIDWSSFDQLMPHAITDIYYSVFLPRLLVTSHGYQPTFEHPSHPSLDPITLYTNPSTHLSLQCTDTTPLLSFWD